MEREKNPLGIKRIDHIAIAAPSLEERTRFFEELFGMRSDGVYDHPEEGYRGTGLSIPGSETGLEVLEPIGEGSFLRRFIDNGGSMYHHVTFEVHDIEEAARALRERGIEPFGMRTENAWNKELFIHPRDTGGILIQLFEQHDRDG